MERLETEICRLVSGPPIDVLIGLINWLKRELSLREGVVLGPLGRWWGADGGVNMFPACTKELKEAVDTELRLLIDNAREIFDLATPKLRYFKYYESLQKFNCEYAYVDFRCNLSANTCVK